MKGSDLEISFLSASQLACLGMLLRGHCTAKAWGQIFIMYLYYSIIISIIHVLVL